MRRFIPVLLAAAVFLPGTAVAQQDTVTEESFSFDVSDGDEIVISTINGSIEAAEYGGSSLDVSYVITCDDAEELEALSVYHETSDGVEFGVEYPDEWHGGVTAVVDFTVAVPSSVDLDIVLQTVEGSVALTGCTGSAEINTVDGSADVNGFSGGLCVNLVEGDMTLTGTPMLSSANLVDGTITGTLDRLDCDVEVSAVDGTVNLVLPRDVHVSVVTLSGDISVPGGQVVHEMVGSSAEYGEGDFSVDVSTVSADVDISH